MNKEELYDIAEEARIKRLQTQPRKVDEMIATIRDLHKRYPNGRIPMHESPMVRNEVFLDICERIVALEEAYTVLLNERARRNDNI